MRSRFTGYRAVAVCFWIMAATAIVLWRLNPTCDVGWDSKVYLGVLQSLRAGHDPYADGLAVQHAFRATAAQHPGMPVPFTYVYSPITLVLLGLVARMPLSVSSFLFWVVYAVGLVTAIWIGLQLVRDREQPVMQLIAPVVVFFPGMLLQDAFFSGNVAYILYGAILLAAYVGWKRRSWWLFYAVALAASCVKLPMLTVLAIPLFSARRQWLPVCGTAALGGAIFALQPAIWPNLFRHYLESLELMFRLDHDFGSGPVGLLAETLFNRVPYQVTSSVVYAAVAGTVVVLLWKLSRRFLAGFFTLQEYAPVLLLGVLLLNPRIQAYDIAPITLPMVLILWRFLRNGLDRPRAIAMMAVVFALLQKSSPVGMGWRWTACMLIVTLFGLGVWDLFTTEKALPWASAESVDVDVFDDWEAESVSHVEATTSAG